METEVNNMANPGPGSPDASFPCFLCLAYNQWRYFYPSTKKWKEDQLYMKLVFLFGNEVASNFEEPVFVEGQPKKKPDDGHHVCFSCVCKLNYCYKFTVKAHESIDKLTHKPANTPTCTTQKPARPYDDLNDVSLTTKRKVFASTPSPLPLSIKTTRKRLDFSIGSVPPIASDDTVDTVDDHDYSLGSISSTSSLPSSMSIDNDDVVNGNVTACMNMIDKEHCYDGTDIIVVDDHRHSHKPHTESSIMNSMSSKVSQQKPAFFESSSKATILNELEAQCQGICSTSEPSVLRHMSSISDIVDGGIFEKCIAEMDKRCPFLLEILMTVCRSGPKGTDNGMKHMGAIALIYGMLMHMRCMHLSSVQRALTLVFIKSSLNDQGLNICNHLGLTLSPASKIRLLDEAVRTTKTAIVQQTARNPIFNIVGDNCDVRVTPKYVTSQNQVKDCHYFALMLVYSRLSELHQQLSSIPPTISCEELSTDSFLLTDGGKDQLLTSYKVILGRMCAKNLHWFRWMEAILPDHIPHEFSDAMKQKSKVYPLEILMKNESKYEDCFGILDESTKIIGDFHEEALGEKPSEAIPFYGDQLTRVRLQGAKALRAMSPSPEKRFDHVGPFICTLWHVKQDFLHKAYKCLYKDGTSRDPGTLNYFKVLLRLSDVNGNVKSNYAAHEGLLLLVGELMIMEQMMSYMKMTSYDQRPEAIPENVLHLSRMKKRDLANEILLGFLSYFQYGEFSLSGGFKSKTNPPKDGATTSIFEVFVNAGGKIVVKEEVVVVPTKEDQVMAHASNLCYWSMHLMNMNDIAKEGDLERTIQSCKMSIPFFFSHSKLSKYFVECIDILLKTQHISSPKTQLRLLEGSFVNMKGGAGNNIETDLAMEHSIRNKKDLIRSLKSNKTEKAIRRLTGAADTVATLEKNVCKIVGVSNRSGRHSRKVSDVDAEKVRAELKKLEPFKFTAGRKYQSMPQLHPSPLSRINMQQFDDFVKRVVSRLCRGQVVEVDVDDNDVLFDQDGLPN